MTTLKIKPVPSITTYDDQRFKKLNKKYGGKLFKPPFRCTIVGSSGSGKTSFVYSLLDDIYHKYFDLIYIFSMTSSSDDALNKIKCYDGEGPEIFHDFNLDDFNDLIEEIQEEQENRKEEKKIPLRICMLFDDFITDKRLFNPQSRTTLDKLYTMGRHLNISVLVISQLYTNALSKNVRHTNCTQLVLYNLSNQNLDMVSREHTPAGSDEKNFKLFLQQTLGVPYQFVIVDYQKANNKRVRMGFDKIVKINKKE